MPMIKAIEVRLDVADLKRSAAFYVDVLGFDIGTLWPDDFSTFAILNRDGQRLQLGKRDNTSTGDSPSACTLCLDISGIIDLHSTIKEKVSIEWGPEVYFYHRRELRSETPTDIWSLCPKSPTIQ